MAEPRLTRRRFVGTLAGLGLAGPLAAGAQSSGRRGGGGSLRLLSTPTTVNPYFTQTYADEAAARIFHEPLATFAEDGTLVPVLADHVPTVENGEVAKDGTWVTWHLKRGVVWHDGRPFTADDVVFNWEYGTDPAMTTRYQGVERVERLHDHAVRVVFEGSSVRPPHPVLGDPAVRAALSLLVDRGAIATELYGRSGRATTNFLNGPPAFASPNTRGEFDVEKASRVLEAAGWPRGPDGVRARDGRRLRLLFQTTSTPIRQKTQAVIKLAVHEPASRSS